MALNDSTKWVGRFDIKPTVSDNMTLLLMVNQQFSFLDLRLQIAYPLIIQMNQLKYYINFPEFV